MHAMKAYAFMACTETGGDVAIFILNVGTEKEGRCSDNHS